MSNDKNQQDIEFEKLMDVQISDERLKEMNKKLPEWSLEPPYSFLK